MLQASATQRSGRAGRVQPGVCYRLYPKRMHDEVFEAHQAPELLRVPLEGLCLQVCICFGPRCSQALASAIMPCSVHLLQL